MCFVHCWMFELHCAERCLCSSTPEGCFHFHLLKDESFNELILNLSLRFCDSTTRLELIMVHYATYTYKCCVETWLFSRNETFVISNVRTFIYSVFFSEWGGGGVSLTFCWKFILLFCSKTNYYSLKTRLVKWCSNLNLNKKHSLLHSCEIYLV